MTPCLTPDEFVDLVDGALAADREAHLATCAACAATATDVREVLAAALSADVPEPSPLFWPGVNARVQAAVAASPATGWRAWLRLDVLVPIAGLALVVMAIASAIDAVSPAGAGASDITWTITDGARSFEVADGVVDEPAAEAAVSTADDALAMMADLASTLPEGGWDALGVTRLPDLDIAAAALTADERDALAALLQSAVERPKS
ncbi:MAG: hypothetical protein JNL48_01575 [Acidobacteria bacterium]|nr:hypothetical protein [Acidobacteriota bacterium]